ncbi:MAG: hypothetical protein ABIH25_00990 [Candidatus Woesearchaeota archaeon]
MEKERLISQLKEDNKSDLEQPKTMKEEYKKMNCYDFNSYLKIKFYNLVKNKIINNIFKQK